MCSVEKVFLGILKNSQENTCARAFIKRDCGTGVFLVNFAKLLRTPFLQIISLCWATAPDILQTISNYKSKFSYGSQKIIGFAEWEYRLLGI